MDKAFLTSVFVNDTPLLDVRAQIEFDKGAFPGATNLPILNDQERHEVGISYKNDGPEAAEQLGHQLVSGAQRDRRIQQWVEFINEHPGAVLYCFRGGKRSQIACQWLEQAGYAIPRISGGYKTMRNFLLEQFTALPALLIVSGRTGVGKTDLLASFETSIDLEGLANHRGSAFGKRINGQPAQIDFENALAIELLRYRNSEYESPVVLEDESRLIGRIQIPVPLKAEMDRAPIVVVQESLEDRVERILRDYILSQFSDLESVYGDQALVQLSEQLLGATDAIRKRLGGVAHQRVRKMVADAIETQRHGDPTAHRAWICELLQHYYDPMYDYQLQQKQDRVIFEGSREAIVEWSIQYQQNTH
jgi:tRNA 2-selenouridine synthase